MLERIVAQKKKELALIKDQIPLEVLENKSEEKSTNGFGKRMSFSGAIQGKGVSLIAEMKKASPSKGLLKSEYEPARIARCYEENGAAAISVLTESAFFLGSLQHLREVRETVEIPLLRKDFVIDSYQIYEAFACGADAVLLIAALLEEKELLRLRELAFALGMESLVEVHTEDELKKAVACGARLLGINNRDLTTFQTDLNVTLRLAEIVPDSCLLVSESGIARAAEIKLLGEAGVDAVLVGEAIMKSRDLCAKVRELSGR